ncbi:MAG: hypothetical protein NC906_06220 [Candidatus Omnitrophica bacterium]|nr:hypothetical protein [Candidatus Omnitrophota bacterium]MCM8817459.1 hypothetical protein [Candidatus Omnitrophota bacterium]
MIDDKEKSGIPVLIELLGNNRYYDLAKGKLKAVIGQDFGRLPPVVSKKTPEEYNNKWKDWWEHNKDTFQFPEKTQ